MTPYKNKYRTESIRLKGWDYTASGYYFVTFCTKNQECFLGEVVTGELNLSAIGDICCQHWFEIPNHFPNAVLDEFVIMPNHVHGIIILTNTETPRVETPRVETPHVESLPPPRYLVN